MSFDLLSAIKNIAPMIAGTFGTPLLGMAVSAICSTLPADQAATVQAAHTSDPVGGALGKLGDMFQQGILSTAQVKQAEAVHAERMAEIGYKNVADLEKIASDDRDSARRREEIVKDKTPAILAYMIIGGFFAVSVAQLVIIMGYPDLVAKIPQPGWLLIGNVSGYLAAEAKATAAYYFGSTSGSKSKDITIDKALNS